MPAATRLSLPDARRLVVRGEGLADPQPRSAGEFVHREGGPTTDNDGPVAALPDWRGAGEVAWR